MYSKTTTQHTYVFMYMQRKQLQMSIFLHYTLYFTCSLGENNGLFQEESNETEEVSIYQFILLLHTYVM